MNLRCSACDIGYEDPFFCCPNCGRQLLHARRVDSSVIEFAGEDWRRCYMVRIGQRILNDVRTPQLTAEGFRLGNPEVLMPLLILYRQLRDPDRQLLEL